MSCGRAGDAILDELGLNLRSSKRGRPKKSVDATPTVVSASTEPITAGPSNANPGTSSDVAKLQSTVDALAEQMAWFVEKLRGDVDDTPSDAESTDTAGLPQAAGVSDSDGQAGQSAAATDPGADTLTGIESFYAASANVGLDIDAQLAKIVSGFLTTRLPDDKLKEKLSACLAPKNCASIVSARVNAEIWDKLSTQTKSRDVKSQRTQNALVGAIAGITVTADTLVRASRLGDSLSNAEMASTLTSLVDALALLGNVNLDFNQRRRDDQRGDINKAYMGLCKDGADGSALLYGDNLSTRIDDINRSNKVASSLGKASASGNVNSAYQPNSAFRSSRGRSTGRQQPYGYGSSGSRGGWLGKFRAGFLDRESRPSWRGKSSPRRGQRQRTKSANHYQQSGRDTSTS